MLSTNKNIWIYFNEGWFNSWIQNPQIQRVDYTFKFILGAYISDHANIWSSCNYRIFPYFLIFK